MDSFNNGAMPLPTSFKPSIKDSGGKRSNNENELSPELASKLKIPSKKQLPTKNFMSPTISAANRASVPKKKILGERNETSGFIEQTSHLTSSSFCSKPMKSPIVDAPDDKILKPYDPITNYLSPRPKYLRYNPNRRRNMLVRQGTEDCVKLNSSFYAGCGQLPSSGLETGEDSSVSSYSSSKKQSVEESEDEINKEDDGDEIEKEEEKDGDETEDDEEEEMVEFGEDRCCSLKGFLKVFFVAISLILTTQAICSMNSPTSLETLESLWRFSDHYTNVHRAAGLNLSEVGYDLVKEPDLLVGRLDGDVCHDYEGLDMMETIEDLVADNFHQEEVVSKEVENDETEDVTHDEIFQENEIVAGEVAEINNVEAEKDVDEVNQDEISRENEIEASEAVEINNVEAEKEGDDVTQDDLIEYDADAEYEITQDIVKKEIGYTDTTDVLMNLASWDPIFAVSIGLSILILTTLGGIITYRSKGKISISSTPVSPAVAKEKIAAEKQEIKIVFREQIYDKQPLVNLQKEVSEEISHIHAPSVELLGEFVFGEEVTSDKSAIDSMIQPTTLSSSQTKYSHVEMSTGDSYSVKKKRRKAAEMVTPSSVRKSSRLQSRTSS